MPYSFDKTFSLDLSMQGDFVEIDLSRVTEYSVEPLGNDRWGSAVVEIMPVGAGGQPRSYGTAKEITSATTPGTHNAIDASQDQAVRLVVTTADTKAHGFTAVSGKETS